MADPQFGMFSSVSELTGQEIEERRLRGINVRKAPERITGFADETRLFTQAIEAVNRLKPAFVVVCGDMTHNPDDEDQLAEVNRIKNLLDEDIPIHWVAGNHDVGDAPTEENLTRYRRRFGDDNYSFDHDGSHLVVVNSCTCFDPSKVPHEWDALVEFLGADLQAARDSGCDDIVAFMHHPLFLSTPDEDDSYFVVPRERRRIILNILKSQGVSAVFAGHLHRNGFARDSKLQMVTTGPVGYPLGDDPSGLRIVRIYEGSVEHEYYGLDNLPISVEL